MSSNQAGGHPDMDYSAHNRTYSGFISATKFAVIFLVALLVGMFIFLV